MGLSRFHKWSGFIAIGLMSGAVSTGAIAQDADDPNYAPAPFIADGARNNDPSTGPLAGMTLRLHRALLMVKDLKTSLDFYTGVVGLEVYSVDQMYALDQSTIGNFMFNTPPGTKRRLAYLNTSTEARGLTLREIDADFEVPTNPHIGTLLFEASNILDVYERAKASGAKVIPPSLGYTPPRNGNPERRFMEMGVVDPDGHVIAFYNNFPAGPAGDADWDRAQEMYRLDASP